MILVLSFVQKTATRNPEPLPRETSFCFTGAKHEIHPSIINLISLLFTTYYFFSTANFFLTELWLLNI